MIGRRLSWAPFSTQTKAYHTYYKLHACISNYPNCHQYLLQVTCPLLKCTHFIDVFVQAIRRCQADRFDHFCIVLLSRLLWFVLAHIHEFPRVPDLCHLHHFVCWQFSNFSSIWRDIYQCHKISLVQKFLMEELENDLPSWDQVQGQLLSDAK